MLIHTQLLRYAVVGLCSNLVLYFLYLSLTRLGLGHKTAMTLLYVAGTSLTFVFNKTWTFGHKGLLGRTFFAYSSIYAAGYIVNLIALYVLVDRLGYDHRWVQGVMIILIALLLFTLQKSVVFKKT